MATRKRPANKASVGYQVDLEQLHRRHEAQPENLEGARLISEQVAAVQGSLASALAPHMKEYDEARQRLRAVMGELHRPDVEEARLRLSSIMDELHSPAREEAKRLGAAMRDYGSIADEAQKMLLGSRSDSPAEEYLRSMEESRFTHEAPIHHLSVPQNPLIETNRHLATTNEKIDALIEVQAKQTNLVDALLAANLTSSTAQDRAAKANLRLTVISVTLGFLAVVAAFMGIIG